MVEQEGVKSNDKKTMKDEERGRWNASSLCGVRMMMMKVKQDGVSVEVKVQRRREEKPLGSQLAESELCAKTAWGQHLRSSMHPIIRAGIRRISAASAPPVLTPNTALALLSLLD